MILKKFFGIYFHFCVSKTTDPQDQLLERMEKVKG